MVASLITSLSEAGVIARRPAAVRRTATWAAADYFSRSTWAAFAATMASARCRIRSTWWAWTAWSGCRGGGGAPRAFAFDASPQGRTSPASQ